VTVTAQRVTSLFRALPVRSTLSSCFAVNTVSSVCTVIELLIDETYIHITVYHSGRAVYGVGLRPFDAGIVGSNPALGMDVCLL
jgi:hypothetical protein